MADRLTEKRAVTGENIISIAGDKFSYRGAPRWRDSYIYGAAADRLAAYEDLGTVEELEEAEQERQIYAGSFMRACAEIAKLKRDLEDGEVRIAALEAERDAAAADVAKMIELCDDAKGCEFCACNMPNAGGPGEDGCGRGREGCIPEWRGVQKGGAE